MFGAGWTAPNSEPGTAVWAPPPGRKPADCGAGPEPADEVVAVVVEKLNNPPDGAVPNNGATQRYTQLCTISGTNN